MNPYDYLRPLLFRLDPERAHDRTLALLARMPVFMPRGTGGKPVELMGLTFPNRLWSCRRSRQKRCCRQRV